MQESSGWHSSSSSRVNIINKAQDTWERVASAHLYCFIFHLLLNWSVFTTCIKKHKRHNKSIVAQKEMARGIMRFKHTKGNHLLLLLKAQTHPITAWMVLTPCNLHCHKLLLFVPHVIISFIFPLSSCMVGDSVTVNAFLLTKEVVDGKEKKQWSKRK